MSKQSLCFERKTFPACTSNCVLLQSPEPLPKLEPPRNLAKIAHCQAGTVGPVPIDWRWVPCFLSVSDPVTSFDSSLPQLQIPWANRLCCQRAQDLKLTILDQCPGAQPWISIQLNSLNTRFIQIVDSAFSARSVCEATSTHTEPEHSVLPVHNEGKRLDRVNLRER